MALALNSLVILTLVAISLVLHCTAARVKPRAGSSSLENDRVGRSLLLGPGSCPMCIRDCDPDRSHGFGQMHREEAEKMFKQMFTCAREKCADKCTAENLDKGEKYYMAEAAKLATNAAVALQLATKEGQTGSSVLQEDLAGDSFLLGPGSCPMCIRDCDPDRSHGFGQMHREEAEKMFKQMFTCAREKCADKCTAENIDKGEKYYMAKAAKLTTNAAVALQIATKEGQPGSSVLEKDLAGHSSFLLGPGSCPMCIRDCDPDRSHGFGQMHREQAEKMFKQMFTCAREKCADKCTTENLDKGEKYYMAEAAKLQTEEVGVA